MRLRIVGITIGLSLLSASWAQAQHHLGFAPYYYPQAQTAYAQPPAGVEPSPLAEGAGEEAAGIVASDTAGASDSCCSDCGCDECASWFECYRPSPGWFTTLEYNLWWTKARSLPPLVTTGPPNLIDPFNVGGLDDPGTQILFGGNGVGEGVGNGGRITIGKWFDSYESFGVGGRFWAFRAGNGSYSGASDGTTNLTMPFLDAQTNTEEAYLVGLTSGVTPLSSGSINVSDRLDALAAEAFLQFQIYHEPGLKLNFMGGYHMLRLDNSLQINSSLTSLDPVFISPVGTNIAVQDLFDTKNEFHGGEFGLAVNTFRDRWSFNLLGKLSIGNMNQTTTINGTTVVTTPGPVVDVRNEGLFALGTNMGTFERNKIAYIPEVNARVGYWIHPNVNVSLGYTFMYINNVLMAGDQIDRSLNLSQTNGGPLVGPARPAYTSFRETDFWAQGINFGIEGKF